MHGENKPPQQRCGQVQWQVKRQTGPQRGPVGQIKPGAPCEHTPEQLAQPVGQVGRIALAPPEQQAQQSQQDRQRHQQPPAADLQKIAPQIAGPEFAGRTDVDRREAAVTASMHFQVDLQFGAGLQELAWQHEVVRLRCRVRNVSPVQRVGMRQRMAVEADGKAVAQTRHVQRHRAGVRRKVKVQHQLGLSVDGAIEPVPGVGEPGRRRRPRLAVKDDADLGIPQHLHLIGRWRRGRRCRAELRKVQKNQARQEPAHGRQADTEDRRTPCLMPRPGHALCEACP